MKLTIHIDYHTAYGESLYLTGDCEALGSGDMSKALAMTSVDGMGWTARVELSAACSEVTYGYIVKSDADGRVVRTEWGKQRTYRMDSHLLSAEIFDRWQDQPSDKPFHSTAFTDCICRPNCTYKKREITPDTLTLMVDAATVLPQYTLVVCGSCKALGNWNPAKAPELNPVDFPRWSVQLPLSELPDDVEYKLVLVDRATHATVAWERGDNRRLHINAETARRSDAAMVVSGLFFENPLPHWRGAGVAIPVFSLRSDKDFGVGDFYDLKLMIDWAAKTGQQFVQLLPINDTTMTHTWTDSYPYNANSTFALHPMYLRVTEMGTLKDTKRQSWYESKAVELNTLPEVDYEAANQLKDDYTRELFAQDGKKTMQSKDFKAFVERNIAWLKPYAAFCTLRDRYRTPDPSQWEEYAVFSPVRIEKLAKQSPDDFGYIYYIQYHLDKQLRHVRDYAHNCGVALKGDIPIGISHDSVDAWTQPELFNLDCSAGAPPDDFSIMGQNWGFPTYNWDRMAADGYKWWRARFTKMAEYFDAYRIDHVLGFFRIWQIPLDALHGLLGVFNPALPFTPEELHQSYGFYFDRDYHTRPYIADWCLGNFFGDLTDEVRATYLNPIGNSRYALKAEVNTQRKVADLFSRMEKTDKNDAICRGLMLLIDDVLFIEDPYRKGTYHPRIAAQNTFVYRSMNDWQRNSFDRLYNDFFYHRHNNFWQEKAMQKLPALIDATDMLVCAEDLGMIPACVPNVMSRLEILSLEIQRMPKDPAVTFADTWHYPYLSVCTTSTHDMPGIRQWWEEDPALSQRYYNEVLHHQGASPFYAEPWICRDIVELHLKSPSMLCILPLQDWLSTNGNLRRQDPRQEQINVPANSRHYWRYRMHLTLEQLLGADSFNQEISKLISQSGRH